MDERLDIVLDIVGIIGLILARVISFNIGGVYTEGLIWIIVLSLVIFIVSYNSLNRVLSNRVDISGKLIAGRRYVQVANIVVLVFLVLFIWFYEIGAFALILGFVPLGFILALYTNMKKILNNSSLSNKKPDGYTENTLKRSVTEDHILIIYCYVFSILLWIYMNGIFLLGLILLMLLLMFLCFKSLKQVAHRA